MHNHLGLRILRWILVALAVAVLAIGVVLLAGASGASRSMGWLGGLLGGDFTAAVETLVAQASQLAALVCGVASVVLFAMSEVMDAMVSVSERVERLEGMKREP